MLAAQRVNHLRHRHRAVFDGDAGVLRLRAFLAQAHPHQAGERGRDRRAVVDGRDRRRAATAPPVACALERLGVVGAGKDALAMAVGPQAGVQIDPANALGRRAMLAHHAADSLVAPGRLGAAEEQAVGEGILTTGHRSLKGLGSALLHELGDGRLVHGVRRPTCRQQQRMQLGIGRVDRQGFGEILEVAVQVHVLVRGAPDMRKTVGVERVHVQNRHALRTGVITPFMVMQREDLHARAAIALDAMAGAADDEQGLGVHRAIARDVHGQYFAIASGQGMHMALNLQTGRRRALQELGARLGVTGREGIHHADRQSHDAATPISWRLAFAESVEGLSHSSARRTQ